MSGSTLKRKGRRNKWGTVNYNQYTKSILIKDHSALNWLPANFGCPAVKTISYNKEVLNLETLYLCFWVHAQTQWVEGAGHISNLTWCYLVSEIICQYEIRTQCFDPSVYFGRGLCALCRKIQASFLWSHETYMGCAAHDGSHVLIFSCTSQSRNDSLAILQPSLYQHCLYLCEAHISWVGAPFTSVFVCQISSNMWLLSVGEKIDKNLSGKKSLDILYTHIFTDVSQRTEHGPLRTWWLDKGVS